MELIGYNEMERLWKEAVLPNLRHYYGICLEGLKQIMKNLNHNGQRSHRDPKWYQRHSYHTNKSKRQQCMRQLAQRVHKKAGMAY
jgi:hypothetical protein